MLDQGVMGKRTHAHVVPAEAEKGGWSHWPPDTRQPFALGRSSVEKTRFSSLNAHQHSLLVLICLRTFSEQSFQTKSLSFLMKLNTTSI